MPQTTSADAPPRSYAPQLAGYAGSMLIWGLLDVWQDPFGYDGFPGSFCSGVVVAGFLGLPLARVSELAEEFTIGLRWPYWTHHLVVMAVVSCVVALIVCARDVQQGALPLQSVMSLWLGAVSFCAPYAVITSLTRFCLRQRM
jgi:hypothetical protein